MIARQRQSEILRSVEAVGAVSVAELAARFAVADETIRRDLATLATRGRLVRTHGGAVRPEDDGADPPFAVRSAERLAEKRAIASLAAARLRPGQVIAFDASSTALEVARRLPDASLSRPLTVVSSGLDVVRLLAERPGVTVVSTGGEFDPSGACFVGPIAEGTLRQFAFDHAVVSCKGFDTRRGASEATPAQAAIKRLMLELANEATLVADSSKLGASAACLFARLGRFASIVTDAAVPRASRGALARACASVAYAKPENTGN